MSRSTTNLTILALAHALLAACGGRVQETTDANAPTCPAQAPSNGASCSGPLTCDYGEHGDCLYGGGVQIVRACQGGSWVTQAIGGCDQPPPGDGGPPIDADAAPGTCPPQRPAPGTPCSGSLDCYYGDHGDCTYGSGGVLFRFVCADGVWTKTTNGTCPPPPDSGTVKDGGKDGAADGPNDAGKDVTGTCTGCLSTMCSKEMSACKAKPSCKQDIECFFECTLVQHHDPVTCATVTCASTDAEYIAVLQCAMAWCQAECQ
jgi:hypothetical protein